MLRRQVRRAQHQASCDPVELEHRKRRGQLVLGREQHARAAQFLESPAEGGMPREIGELDYAAGAVQAPGRERPVALIDSHSERSSLGKVFVQLDEVTEGDGKLDRDAGVERIDAE